MKNFEMDNMEQSWWKIQPDTLTDTPFLAVFEHRVSRNIEQLVQSVGGDTFRLRPHIKTHKLGEILELLKLHKIYKVKCATIAEAELCALHQMPDILLAFQPGGLKLQRWIELIQKYPQITFATIVDNLESARHINAAAEKQGFILSVYVDMNTGMNRTGVDMHANWDAFAISLSQLPHILLKGIHIYDGHLKGTTDQRSQAASKAFIQITEKLSVVEEKLNRKLKVVAGGSNTFPYYATLSQVECSPGTFVFWDLNYLTNLPEQPFIPAAVIVGTVISKPTPNTLCIDIGYKSVASENALEKRLVVLNDENLLPLSHSEEHLVLENKGDHDYAIGDTIYALPFHVCPTVALYDSVQVVNSQQQIYTHWQVLARNRKINI